MRSIVAKWSIKPGCEQQAVAALSELAESVRREEPFTLMYLIHTPDAVGSRPTPARNEVIFVTSEFLDRRAGFIRQVDGGASLNFLTGVTT